MVRRPEAITQLHRTMGEALKVYREAAGLNQGDLARATSHHRTYISHVEAGRHSPAQCSFWEDADGAVGAAGELLAVYERVCCEILLIKRAGIEREQAARQARVRELAARIPTKSAIPETTAAVPRKFSTHSATQIDEVVNHLREQWHLLVRTDNLLGPRFALEGVRNQLVTIEELLSTVIESGRQHVVRLASQYAESAAWLYEDSGNLAKARYWAGRALEWAYEADDRNMLAWTSFRRSQQAGRVRDVVQVIGLAQTARRDEDRLPSPMRAAILVQEAQGHAMNRDERTAQQLLEEAHTWAIADTTGDARGGHGSFCTPGYIELQRAATLTFFGRPKRAISVYEEALPALPAVYERDRAAALCGMAAAYTAADRPPQAADTAMQALRAARSAGSIRIVKEIEAVGLSLRSYQDDQAVGALLEELAKGNCHQWTIS